MRVITANASPAMPLPAMTAIARSRARRVVMTTSGPGAPGIWKRFTHTQAASSLSGELYAPFHRGRGGPGGWIILNEPELHLHGDVLVPDIGGWRRERMPTLPTASAFELAPDWVCEVLSPSTASTDRAVKMPIYAREKVGHVWLVDPLLQTLEVLRLDGTG